MADTKAEEALKDAESKSNIKLKVYYNGDTPAECGSVDWEYNLEPLDAKHQPWLFKVYTEGYGGCHQFTNTALLYTELSNELRLILDTAIVNAKQRESVGLLVDKVLAKLLCEDKAHSGDTVV